MMRLFLACAFCLWVASPTSVAAAPVDAAHCERTALQAAIIARLQVMPAVAHWKWQQSRPVEDLAREQVVLERTVQEAAAFGLDADWSRAFVGMQIEASKSIQSARYQHWRAHGAPEHQAPDLVATIRPAIDELTADLLKAASISAGACTSAQLQALRQALIRAELPKALAERMAVHVQRIDRRTATAANGSRLDWIKRRGVLRVGTTGDYPPFSHIATDGATPIGIDPRLAQHLADSLQVQLQWVQTSWPTLMQDLSADAFDIAMSGVSRNTTRAQVALFSDPYHVGGKSAISRCSDAARFGTLAAIDTPKTTVIVNPGGTNQQFVNTRVRNAQVRVFDDNRAIFTELARAEPGAGDIMFTDLIEVLYQSAREPTLCPALNGATLTYQEKGYLLPRDPIWQSYVNLWLAQIQGDGTLARAFAEHIGSIETD